MKRIGIVTDSHSGITQEAAQKMGIFVLPMPFFIEEKCYLENVSLTREELFEKLRGGVSVSTSQPTPAEVMEIWDRALCEYEQILYIPISSGLSGSCSTASAMAQDEPYEGKVFVVDNGRVATPLHRSVLDAMELADQGLSAEKIKEILERDREKMVIYIGVETLEYLKRGGRISAATAAVGAVLNIKPILKFDVGVLEPYKKCRGFAKVKKTMIEAMKEELNTRFSEEYKRGEVYLMAASSASEKETQAWVEEIEAAFPGMQVMCDPLSMGVSCHIGPGGLGIGCSVKAKA